MPGLVYPWVWVVLLCPRKGESVPPCDQNSWRVNSDEFLAPGHSKLELTFNNGLPSGQYEVVLACRGIIVKGSGIQTIELSRTKGRSVIYDLRTEPNNTEVGNRQTVRHPCMVELKQKIVTILRLGSPTANESTSTRYKEVSECELTLKGTSWKIVPHCDDIDKSVLKNVIVSDQIGEISMNFRHSSNNVVNISLDCGEIDRFMRKEMSKTGNMDYQHERSEMFDLSEGKDESTYTISYFPSCEEFNDTFRSDIKAFLHLSPHCSVRIDAVCQEGDVHLANYHLDIPSGALDCPLPKLTIMLFIEWVKLAIRIESDPIALLIVIMVFIIGLYLLLSPCLVIKCWFMVKSCANGLGKWRHRKHKLKKTHSRKIKATNYEDGDVLLVYESTTDVKNINEKKVKRKGAKVTMTSEVKSHHARRIKEKQHKRSGNNKESKYTQEMHRQHHNSICGPPRKEFTSAAHTKEMHRQHRNSIGGPLRKEFTIAAQQKDLSRSEGKVKKHTPPPKPPLPENYYRYTSHEWHDNPQSIGAVEATQVSAQTTTGYQILQPFEYDEASVVQIEKPAFRQQSPHHVAIDQPRASGSEKSTKIKSSSTWKNIAKSNGNSEEVIPHTSIVLEDSKDWKSDDQVYGNWPRSSISECKYSFLNSQYKTPALSEGMLETFITKDPISPLHVPSVEENVDVDALSEEVKSDTVMTRSWTEFFTHSQLISAIQMFLKELDSTISDEIVDSFSTDLSKSEAAKAIEVLFTVLDLSMVDKESGALMPLNQVNATSAISAFLIELDKSLSAKESAAEGFERDKKTRVQLLDRKEWDPENSLKAFLFLLDEIQPPARHSTSKTSSTKENEEKRDSIRCPKGLLHGVCHSLKSPVQSFLRNLDPSLSEDEVSSFIDNMDASQLEEAVEAFLIHLGLEIDGERTDQFSLPQSNKAIGVLLQKLDSKELARADENVDLTLMIEHSSNYIHLHERRILQLRPLDPSLSDRAIKKFMTEISSLESPIGGTSEQINESRTKHVSGASVCTPLAQSAQHFQTQAPDTSHETSLTRHSESSLHSSQARRKSYDSKKVGSTLNSASSKSDSNVLVGKNRSLDDRMSVKVASEHRKSRQIFKKSSVIETPKSNSSNSKSSLDKLADAQVKCFEISSKTNNSKSNDRHTIASSKTSSSRTTLKQSSDTSSTHVPRSSKKSRKKTEEDYSSLRSVPMKPDSSVKYTLVRRHTLSGGEVSTATQQEQDQEQQWDQFDPLETSPRYQLSDILFSPGRISKETQSPQPEMTDKSTQSPPDYQHSQNGAEQLPVGYVNFDEVQDACPGNTGDLCVRAMEEDIALRKFIKSYQKAQDSGFSFTGVSSDSMHSLQELQPSDPNIGETSPKLKPLNQAFDFVKELKKSLPTPLSFTSVSHDDSTAWSDSSQDQLNHPRTQSQEPHEQSTETEGPVQTKTRKIRRKTTDEESQQPMVQVITKSLTERRTLSCKDPLQTEHILENSSPQQTKERKDSSERSLVKHGIDPTFTDNDQGLSSKNKSTISLPLPSKRGLLDFSKQNTSFHSLQRHFYPIPSHLRRPCKSNTTSSSSTSSNTWQNYSLQEKSTTLSSSLTPSSMLEHKENHNQELMPSSSVDSDLLQMIALMPEITMPEITQGSSSVTEDSSLQMQNRGLGLEESSTTASSHVPYNIGSALVDMDSMAVHKSSSYTRDDSSSPLLLKQRLRLQGSPLINQNLSSDEPSHEHYRMLQTSSSQIMLDNAEFAGNTSHSSHKLVNSSSSPEDMENYNQRYSALQNIIQSEDLVSSEPDVRHDYPEMGTSSPRKREQQFSQPSGHSPKKHKRRPFSLWKRDSPLLTVEVTAERKQPASQKKHILRLLKKSKKVSPQHRRTESARVEERQEVIKTRIWSRSKGNSYKEDYQKVYEQSFSSLESHPEKSASQ